MENKTIKAKKEKEVRDEYIGRIKDQLEGQKELTMMPPLQTTLTKIEGENCPKENCDGNKK